MLRKSQQTLRIVVRVVVSSVRFLVNLISLVFRSAALSPDLLLNVMYSLLTITVSESRKVRLVAVIHCYSNILKIFLNCTIISPKLSYLSKVNNNALICVRFKSPKHDLSYCGCYAKKTCSFKADQTSGHFRTNTMQRSGNRKASSMLNKLLGLTLRSRVLPTYRVPVLLYGWRDGCHVEK